MNELNTLIPDLRLKFHIENPSLEECYAYGYESALADIEEHDNPYQEGSCEHEHWSEGWWAGFYNEQPLFTVEKSALEPEITDASNDALFQKRTQDNYLLRVLEIAGVIAVSAILGYQVIDIVA